MNHTERGFAYTDFKDTYGQSCSLQKSSSAEEDKIWLGVDNTNGLGGDFKNVRMHLNQEQVTALLPYLQRFVETGELE